jgi:hypothetical protein
MSIRLRRELLRNDVYESNEKFLADNEMKCKYQFVKRSTFSRL